MKEPFILLDQVVRVGDERVPVHAELVGRSGRTIYLPTHWLPRGAEVGALLNITKDPGADRSAFRCDLLALGSAGELWERALGRIPAWTTAGGGSVAPPVVRSPHVLDTFLAEATSPIAESVARLASGADAAYLNAEFLPLGAAEGDTLLVTAEVLGETSQVVFDQVARPHVPPRAS